MKQLTFDISEPTFDLVLAGDTHEGSVTYHEKGVKQLINYVSAEPNRYWAHMGDWIEAITTDDKRYAWNQKECPIPIKQAEAACETFSPIAEKCFCSLIGNHELRLHRFGNLVRDIICKNLNIPYGAYMAHVDVKHSGQKLFSMMLWHGPIRGSLSSNAKDNEQRQGNMKASLKMKLKYMMSDCAIQACGHFHRLFVVPPTSQLYIYSQGNKVKQGYLEGIQTGNYIDPDRRWFVCYDKQTEILTEDGYKHFFDLQEGERVIALDPETNNLSLIKPLKIIKQHYRGDMIRFCNSHTDIMVTPDHNMYFVNREGKGGFVKASEIGSRLVSEQSIPKLSNGLVTQEEIEFVEIGGKRYDIKLFLKFLGWYLAEGCVPRLTGLNRANKYEIFISQSLASNPKKYAEIRILCAMMFDRIGCTQSGVYIKGEDNFAEYLLLWGDKSKNKRVPIFVKNLHPSLLKCFLDAFCAGDGTIEKRRGNRHFYSSSPYLANDVYEVIIKSGKSASLHCYQPGNPKWNMMYRVSELSAHTHSILPRYISKIIYDDFVYCVELPRHNVINVRRNYKNVFCGNCTGGFSKLYPDDDEAIGYAEISGYPPVELGFSVVHVVEGKIKDIETIVV